MTKPDFEKKAADAILAWVNQEHLEMEEVIREELYPEFVSHLAALLKSTDASARLETWEKAAQFVGNSQAVRRYLPRFLRAEAEKEPKP